MKIVIFPSCNDSRAECTEMSMPVAKCRGTLVEKHCHKPLYKITIFCKMLKTFNAVFVLLI